MTRRLLLLALLVSGLSVLSGCPAPQGPVDALDLAKARGELIVAMDAGYVPFEVLEPDGSYSGFDIDLINEVAKDLGLKVTLKNVSWNGIIGELNTGKADLIISGMSITDERKKAVLFSEPYYSTGQVVVKRRGDARITSYEDIGRLGLVVATQEATTGEEAVRKTFPPEKFPSVNLLRFPKLDQACLAVIQQKADVVVFDEIGLQGYIREQGADALEGIWEPFTEEPIGAAFRQTSPLLAAAFNKTLARMKQDGSYAALVKKYFTKPGEPTGDASETPAPSTPAAKSE